jgi:hypothetical protein
VKLLVVISVEFKIKNPLSLFDLFDILSDTGADESVLEPTIGSFDFASGLWREGVNDLDVAILKDLFPLRGGFVGQEVVFSPKRIPSLDESEDRMGVNIIGVRQTISKEYGLEGQDMSPAGLLFDQNSIKEESAIIIQGSNEIPFLLGCRCPEMIRGVMLNQFSSIMG